MHETRGPRMCILPGRHRNDMAHEWRFLTGIDSAGMARFRRGLGPSCAPIACRYTVPSPRHRRAGVAQGPSKASGGGMARAFQRRLHRKLAAIRAEIEAKPPGRLLPRMLQS